MLNSNIVSKLNDNDPLYENKIHQFVIKADGGERIKNAIIKAVKKQATISLYSLKVDMSKTTNLGIGIKDISENLLVVSMLKRENGFNGPAEEAGIRLGDIIFGMDFVPLREGSKTLIKVLSKIASSNNANVVHIQGWRCHQLCSDSIPGYLFPRADDMIVQAYALFLNQVFDDVERWNFIEILLG
jgi:hypothetical protein